jgi:hypothetical protein
VPDNMQTSAALPEFDASAYPPETFFYERRSRLDRRALKEPAAAGAESAARPERRARKERRRRVDPTTFEKQYSPDELEFMNAMQRFKDQSGKHFPTYREVLLVAARLGYRRPALVESNGD